MKKLGLLFLILTLLPLVAAAVQVTAPKDVPLLIVGSDDESVSYRLTLTNTGSSSDFEVYSLVGVVLKPDTIHLEQNMPTTITFTASPIDHLLETARGTVKFEYEIFSTLGGVNKHELLMDIAELNDVIFVRPLSVEPGDTTVVLSLQNLKGKTFSNLKVNVKSELVNTETIVTLEPYQTLTIPVQLDVDAMKRLVADTYPLRIDLAYQGAEDRIISNIKYREKGGVAVAESHDGVIIRTTTTEKINEGNVPVTVTISERRDIFTRLLTDHDPSPETATKRGFYVSYTWQKLLAPSERLTVRSTTNYTLPALLLLLIVAGVVGVRLYVRTSLSMVKRVSFVRTRGGEFALKVTIHARARKNLQNITVTDRIPHVMKLFESYGIKPHAVNDSARTISWHMPHLSAGEERMFSYIMYSKLRVVGSFELPMAHANFTHNGKHTSVLSNKTSFVSQLGQARE